MKFLASAFLLLSVLAFALADDASADAEADADANVKVDVTASSDADAESMATRSGYVPEGYSAPPVMKKVIPVKKVVEYVRPQPVISYAPPIPVKSVEPLLAETKHVGGYGPYGSYGGRRDILPAPVIPLVPWQEILEIIAVALEIALREVEPLPAAVANNVNWFARLFKETRNLPGGAY